MARTEPGYTEYGYLYDDVVRWTKNLATAEHYAKQLNTELLTRDVGASRVRSIRA